MFGAIGSAIGRIFGTDKAAESLVNNVAKGFDKLVYTSEEKAEAHARDVSEARSMVIEWMKTTSGQNLARRVLAFFVAGIWGLFYLASAGVGVGAVWVSDPEAVKNLTETGRVLGEYANQMNGAMMLILGFYFAAPHLGKVVDTAMAKFSRKEKAL